LLLFVIAFDFLPFAFINWLQYLTAIVPSCMASVCSLARTHRTAFYGAARSYISPTNCWHTQESFRHFRPTTVAGRQDFRRCNTTKLCSVTLVGTLTVIALVIITRHPSIPLEMIFQMPNLGTVNILLIC
jgi:hypothetical protein